jgi:hypothetical protein
MSHRRTDRLAAQVRPDLHEPEAILAMAAGYPLGWTTRYHLVLVPSLLLTLVTALFFPYDLAGTLVVAAAAVAVGFGTYTLIGRLAPPGLPPIVGNVTVALIATDRRLLVYRGSGSRRTLLLAIALADIDDVVLQRALVGIGRGGVVTVTLLDGARLMVEAPGLSQIDDLAAVVDSIR